MKTYRNVGEMQAATLRNEIPQHVVSPGYAAAELGVTRQAVHDRLKRGTLRAWGTEDGGVIFIDAGDLRSAKREQRARKSLDEKIKGRRYGAGTM